MTFVAESIRLFQSASDEQSKVNGPPNNNHTLKFKEDLLNVTFQITFEGTDGSDPSGTILSNAKYKATNASVVSYDRQLADARQLQHIHPGQRPCLLLQGRKPVRWDAEPSPQARRMRLPPCPRRRDMALPPH